MRVAAVVHPVTLPEPTDLRRLLGYELDGDPLATTTSLVVAVEPGALTVVVPP